MFKRTALTLLLALLVAAPALAQSHVWEALEALNWKSDPVAYEVPGSKSTYSLASDERIVLGDQARRYLALTQGIDGWPEVVALIESTSGPMAGSFIDIEYHEIGYLEDEDWKDVDQIFFRCMGAALAEIRETFPFFKGPFKDMGYQIQRYHPGEFYHWHIDGGSHEFSQRQLVALWYLNDVPGPGGETEFLYQDVSIRPERGKMVLFPPFWTHEHRSATLREGVKYIATTWVVFR